MPTENELKYLLRLEAEEEAKNAAQGTRHVRQGYLAFTKGMSLRIRETNNTRFEMTFKQKANNRVIEVEKKLDERDFEDLWAVACNRLEKIRYDVMVRDHNGNKSSWEIDAFKDHNHETYIMIAEHEMPEDMLEPDFIPSIIQDNLLFAVPRDDDRFASKKIADVKYAQKLFRQHYECI